MNTHPDHYSLWYISSRADAYKIGTLINSRVIRSILPRQQHLHTWLSTEDGERDYRSTGCSLEEWLLHSI